MCFIALRIGLKALAALLEVVGDSSRKIAARAIAAPGSEVTEQAAAGVGRRPRTQE